MTFGKTAVQTIFFPFLILAWCCAFLPAPVAADQGEDELSRAGVLTALNTIRQSLPAAPPGWMIRDETRTNQAGSRFPVRYLIRYRRAAGVREEQKRLDEAYGESSRRHNEAAKPQIDELIRQQTVVSLALRKAQRRRNEAEQKRLNEALEENGRKMRAVHEETDRRISREVEPFLVRDAEAAVTVAVNEDLADCPGECTVFSYDRTAFARQKAGEPIGVTRWKEGEILLLFGSWEQAGANRFRAAARPEPGRGVVRTIRISISAEPQRAERLLKELDVKAILSLMQ